MIDIAKANGCLGALKDSAVEAAEVAADSLRRDTRSGASSSVSSAPRILR